MAKKKIKVEVLKDFRNKYTKSLHKAGDFLYISESRFKEINAVGKLVKKAKEG